MTPHPNVVHWDDVEALSRELGDLRSTRRRLGAAAGASEAGLSLWEIAPGARSTPVHVHADEEELTYVLRGSGLSWQDGRTFRVGEGDCVVHRCEEEAHTLIAGDDGLDVLVFAEGSRTSLTHLPRARTMWAAPHWVPVDGPHPFEAEIAAGPLPVPEPEPERPRTIVALDEVPVQERQRGTQHHQRRDLGLLGGSVRSGLKHVRVAPGATSSLAHCHSAEEELFVVLGGEGTVRLGDDGLGVRRGTVVARPPGTGVAHQFVAGERGLELLAWGHRRPHDACFYPDSGKVWLRGLGDVIFRVQTLDYWDGEEG